MPTGRNKDSQSQYQPPADVFLVEHLEWLLKIGCSVDKILEWAREKQQNQAVETPLHFNSHSGLDSDIPTSSIPHRERTNSVHETFNPQQTSGQYNLCIKAIKSSLVTLLLGPCNSSEHSSGRTKQRKRQQSDKSRKSRPKKSRKKGIVLPTQSMKLLQSMVTADTSPVRFVLINTLQGTGRERQLQLKHNMLQSI